MHGIYSALTNTSSMSGGIKNIDVFYDTTFINVKTFDVDTYQNVEYLLISKLKFNYSSNTFSSEKETLVSFGDTGYFYPHKSNGNCFIKNIFLPERKEVLIFGLSSNISPVTATAGTQQISGHAIIPIIYSYSLNDAKTKRLYPTTEALSSWNNFIMGSYLSAQTPIVSFDQTSNQIDFIFKTNIQTLGASSIAINVINNIQFDYNNIARLTSIRQLTSLPVGNDFKSYSFIGLKTVDDSRMLLSYKNPAIQLCNF